MKELYFSIFGLYVFALAGFVLKKVFKEELNAKSFVLLSLYVFQPILGVWGFVKAPLVFDMLGMGAVYFLTVFCIAGVLFGIGKFFIHDTKYQALFAFTGTSGNTGNIGIPLVTVLVGPVGTVVATMINFLSIIWNFVFGVFFYAKGKFSVQKSLLEIIKLPLLWASLLGIFLNISGTEISAPVEYFLELGAYSAIVIQLVLLGIFVAGIQFKKIDIKISGWIAFVKFIITPVVGIFFLWVYQNFLGEISEEILLVVILQLFTPIAVNNGNLAVLYNCYPEKIAEAIFLSYVIFLLCVPAGLYYVVGII